MNKTILQYTVVMLVGAIIWIGFSVYHVATASFVDEAGFTQASIQPLEDDLYKEEYNTLDNALHTMSR